MAEVKLYAIMVIYKKLPQESQTLKSLSTLDEPTMKNLRLTIWDNSPIPYDSEAMTKLTTMLRSISFEYKHNKGENVPLSKIYNQSITAMTTNECLLLLDDDSEFNADFIHKASQSIFHNESIDLFVPIVRSANKIVSPAKMKLFKGHYLKHVTPGIMDSKNVTAINSGMIIRGSYLKEKFEGYDERIKFYFTDNDFMDRYTTSHECLYVLDYQFSHSLDFYNKKESFSVKSKRFRELRHSFLILMRRKGLIVYLATQIYLIIYSIKFAIQQRDLRFIFVF